MWMNTFSYILSFFHFRLVQEEYGPNQLGNAEVSGILTGNLSLAVGSRELAFAVRESCMNREYGPNQLGNGKVFSIATVRCWWAVRNLELASCCQGMLP